MREILDSNVISSFIHPAQLKYLNAINIVETIPSTNSYLLSAIKALPKGTVIIAEEQTQGRGRQGKSWHSPKEVNLYCSLLWHVHSPALLQPFALAVAVMLIESLEKFGIQTGLQLKWPNDIYFANRKLAGILIESSILQENTYAVVIGFGVNANKMQDYPFGKEAICIAEILGHGVSRNELAGTILDGLLAGLLHYEQEGFQYYKKLHERYDMLRGKYVIVHTAQGDMPGIALGINMQGELLIRNEHGKEMAYHAGEVSVMLG